MNGGDMTDVALPFGADDQSLHDVEVVLTNQLTDVSGRVTDARGHASSDAAVVAFTADRGLWYEHSRCHRACRVGP